MKILAIHNFHRKGSASGDDQVFNNETKLLNDMGNCVVKYTINNSEYDEASILKKVKMTIGMFWSFKHYVKVKKIIEHEKPDVVHVHAFFPLLSPSILYAAHKSGKPVIVTLHDTRLVCPCATSLCNGKLCNSCVDGKYYRMCKNKCYQNSKIKSLIVALIFLIHRKLGTFCKQVDRYICLNNTQKELLIESGISKEKLIKKYNFVEESNKNVEIDKHLDIPNRFVCYFGRLGEEKGIKLLMQIWDEIENIPLVVMWTGPLEEDFSKWAQKKKNIYFLGYTEHEKCMEIVKQSEFVICPSVCYEGCSMVGVEAESMGKPIIGPSIGFFGEAIVNRYNGLKAEINNVKDYVEKIYEIWSDEVLINKMSINAREDYQNKYSPKNNYRVLMQIYEESGK